MVKDNRQFEDERGQHSKAVQQSEKSEFEEEKSDRINLQDNDNATDKTIEMENEPTNDHDPSIPSDGKGKPGMTMPGGKKNNIDLPDEDMPKEEMPGENKPPSDKPTIDKPDIDKPPVDMPGKEVPEEKMPGQKKPDEEMPGHR